MIEHLFVRPSVRRRMAASHLGIILERFALDLQARGYVVTCLQSYVQITEHFSRWLSERRLQVPEVNEQVIERFIGGHLPHCRCRGPAATHRGNCRAALGCFLRFLREQRLIPPPVPQKPTDQDRLVDRYDRYLSEVGGLAANTRHYRRRYAYAFLGSLHPGSPAQLAKLTPTSIVRYVEGCCQRLKPASATVLAVSLRSFLRFLASSGKVDPKLPSAVPHPAPWPIRVPPKVLSRTEFQAFLSCFDRTTAVGRRDFAIAMLMAHLGLRGHEVASLTLDDLDGSRQALWLRETKQRRERLVPWTPAVARALSAYLHRGRLPSASRALFVRHRSPPGSPMHVHHVRSAMRRAFARAGIRSGKIHLLRHSLATRLHSAGVDLKHVADLLGHNSLNTTARYALVNLRQLRQAVLPWPGERP